VLCCVYSLNVCVLTNCVCAVWQTSLDLMSQDEEERRRQKLQAFKELAERLEDERKMMDYRRQQIEDRKEAQVCVCVHVFVDIMQCGNPVIFSNLLTLGTDCK
jgi:monomeric isocitrate dehydrogenase